MWGSDENSVLLPKKHHYIIETIRSHYVHTMYAQQLTTTEEVLRDLAPSYLPQWHTLMNKRSVHIFNVMIMDRAHFDAYYEWLFPILFEITDRLNPKQYGAFHARYPGRISEMLLNVWSMKNDIAAGKLSTTFMERVNWWKTGGERARAPCRRSSSTSAMWPASEHAASTPRTSAYRPIRISGLAGNLVYDQFWSVDWRHSPKGHSA